MLIPIGHDKMSARRWPIITFGLIALNVAVFLSTHSTIETQGSELHDVREHIVILAAMHPNLHVAAEAKELVAYVQNRYPSEWASLQNQNAETSDEWYSRIQSINDPDLLQAEMDALAHQYSQVIATSITQEYGFVATHPRAIAYATSNFLHEDWWHLLGNMWFLWLAGFVLEDAWGRPTYLLVYLMAGVFSCQFDAWTNPGNIAASIGASGAIAGLMGAFLVRFPKKKIRMTWILFPVHRFWIPAYLLLPTWILMEISDTRGLPDGIDHWAHIGGFMFGVILAVLLRRSGLEQRADRAIEEKIAWTPPHEIAEANKLMENGKLDEASKLLNQYLAKNSESYDAWNLLRGAYWQASNIPGYREATGKLCDLHVKAMDWDAAWQDYGEFLKAGGENVPLRVSLGLCRAREERQDYETAASEYEKLAATHPSERESLLAQLAASRIYLKQLNRPHDALRLYQAASLSPVPHLDLELDIQSGIREATAKLSHCSAASTGH